jgi:CheY-like chemotaxis protein
MTTHPRRVLIADDARDAADSLALLLELEGHEVRCAYGGTAAVLLAATFLPEVIFLDLAMPDLDGWTVAQRLRQDLALAGVLIVAVSGHGLPDDVVRAAAAGCDWHLLKPVTPEKVLDVMADPNGYRHTLDPAMALVQALRRGEPPAP